VLKKLFGYAAYMFGANFLTGMLTFGVSALGMVSRSKEAFGDYSMYMRIYEIGQGLFIFGANASIQRFAADDPLNRMRFSALAYYLFLGLLALGGIAGVAVGFSIRWSYAFALFGIPWLVLYWWARYIVRSNLDAKREARLMMISSLANSVSQFVFISFTDLRDALIYGDFVALVVGGLCAISYIASGNGASIPAILKARPPKQLVKDAVRFAVPLWWSGQIFQARHQIQGLWTRAALGPAPMGALQGKDTMWQFAQKPLEYLGQAALPGLVSEKERRGELYSDILRLCLVGFASIGIAVAAGIPLVFEAIDGLSALLGSTAEPISVKYAEVPGLLRILALGMPIVAFETVTNQYSVAENRPKSVLYSNFATVAVVLGSIYPLTLRFGLAGVVSSGLIGAIASSIAYVSVLHHDFRAEMRTALAWTAIATIGSAAALLPVQLYAAERWSWALSFPAVALYLSLMFATRIVRAEDFRRAWRAYRTRGGGAAPGR
jgi:O-antigen/teichoic acid export membrane protein